MGSNRKVFHPPVGLKPWPPRHLQFEKMSFKVKLRLVWFPANNTLGQITGALTNPDLWVVERPSTNSKASVIEPFRDLLTGRTLGNHPLST